MASVTEPPAPDETPEGILARARRFVWLSSGMFSLAALGLAFTGYFAFGSVDDGNANFLAALASGVVFGLASLLKFGPASS